MRINNHFHEETWGKKSHLFKSVVTDQSDLEQLNEVKKYLNCLNFFDNVHVLARKFKGDNKRIYSSKEIDNLLANGYSIQFRNLEKILPSSNYFVKQASQLSKEFGSKLLSISMFVSPPNNQALPIHNDETEIFSFQLHGQKKWKLFDFKVTDEQSTYLDDEVNLNSTIVMNAGDALYLPKGQIHQVKSVSGFSISLALVFEPVTLKDMLCDLIHNLPDTSTLSQTISPKNVIATNDLIQKFNEEIKQSEIQTESFGHEESNNEVFGPIMMESQKIGLSSKFTKYKGASYDIQKGNSKITLSVDSRSLETPKELAFIFEKIIEADDFSFSEFEDFVDMDSLLILAENMKKNRLLKHIS